MCKKIVLLFFLLLAILMAQTAYAIPNPASEFAYIEFEDHIEILGYEGTNTIVEVPPTIGGKPVTSVRLGQTENVETTNRFLGVKKIILPSTVKELGEYAFGYYTQLESIEGLEYIERIKGASIFTFCGVKEACFSARLREVATDAFNNSSLLRATLPDDAFYDQRALTMSDVQELTLLRGEGEPTIRMEGGAVYSADGKVLKSVLPLMKSTYYTIAEGTERVEIGAFQSALFLEEVEFPRSVNLIHNDAGGLYILGHEVTVYVHQDSYTHTFFQEYMEDYPYDAANLTLCVLEDGVEGALTERVEQILAEALIDDMSDIQKARALHDWICENGSYDYSLTKFSAMDILMDGSGVCDAYTRAYCVLLDAAGLESRRITCTLSGTGHAINAIRIGDDWIYVDVTNDDEGFGRPASLFGFNDDIYDAFYADDTAVTADSLAYYAPYTSGEMDAQLDMLSQQIQASIDAGRTSFTVSLDQAVDQIRAVALCSMLEDRRWQYGVSGCNVALQTDNNQDFKCYLSDITQAPEFEYYTNERGHLTITRYNGSAKQVELPATIDGVAVDALIGAFQDNQTVVQVTLPEGLLEIGDYTFLRCTSLETVNFPTTLERIGEGAFDGCICMSADLIFAPGLKSIGQYAFGMCYGVKTASIPGTVQEIGSCAFEACVNLSSVTLGEGIATLPKGVFYNCWNLRELTLPESLTTLVEGVFSKSGVTALRIPARVSDIHWGAFAHAEKLTSLTVAEANAVYAAKDNMLFSKDMTRLIASSLAIPADVTVPSTVTAIEDYAFIHNDALKTIYIPANVRSIGAYAFSNSGLERVYMEDGVERIGRQAFASAERDVGFVGYYGSGTNLQSLRLSGCLKEIGEGMLWGYYPELVLVLPDSLTSIDVHFIDYNMHVYVPESITYIAPQPVREDWFEMVIHGVPGSYAETFAKENGYTFASTVNVIKLSNESLTMLEKEQRTLAVELINGKDASDIASEIVWTSSHDCLSVKDGVITANAMGNAIVTASWNGLSASCEVEVGRLLEMDHLGFVGFGDAITRVGEYKDMIVSGSVEFLRLTDGEWCAVTEYLELSPNVVWSVSDPNVMMLEKVQSTGAVLRAVGPGKCQVTAAVPTGESLSFEWLVAGAQYIDPQTCEHVMVVDPAVEANCLREGRSEGTHCEMCGTIGTPQQVFPRSEHTWNKVIIVQQQSCTEDGEKVFVCTLCGTEKEEKIAPHFWTNGTITVTPTAESTGEMAYTCQRCETTRKEVIVLGAAGDVNEDGVVDQQDIPDLMDWYCGNSVELNLANGEVNGEGEIDMLDIIALMEEAEE